jgi:hypothetical protein
MWTSVLEGTYHLQLQGQKSSEWETIVQQVARNIHGKDSSIVLVRKSRFLSTLCTYMAPQVKGSEVSWTVVHGNSMGCSRGSWGTLVNFYLSTTQHLPQCLIPWHRQTITILSDKCSPPSLCYEDASVRFWGNVGVTLALILHVMVMFHQCEWQG